MEDLTHGLLSPETGAGGSTRPDNRVFRRPPPKNRACPPLCRCGCGRPVNRRYGTGRYGRWQFYLKGHKDNPRRLVPSNEGAFSELTEESAYWAGFLMADGCVGIPRVGSPSVSINLMLADRPHLVAFRTFLGATNGITTVPPKSDSGHAYIHIRSERVVSDLVAIGVTPRKSMREVASPVLASSRHFWRGLVDGDGCLLWWTNRRLDPNRHYPMLSVVGSESIMAQLLSFVRAIPCETGASIRQDKRTPGLWTLELNSTPATIVARELYCGATVALARKRVVAEEMARWKPATRTRRRYPRL